MDNITISTAPAPDTDSGATELTPDQLADYDALVSVGIASAKDSTRKRLMLANILPNDGTVKPRAGHNSPPRAVDAPLRAKAVKCLLMFASGASPSKSMRACGIDWADVQRVRWADVRFCVAWDAAVAMHGEYLAAKAQGALDDLLDSNNQSRASVRAVLFTLERLRRDSFGDPRTASGGDSGGGKGGGITYNINITQSAAPVSGDNLCGRCVDNITDSPIIDTSAL